MNTAARKLVRRKLRAALRASLRDIYCLAIVSYAILFFGHPVLGAVCLALSIRHVWRTHLIRERRIYSAHPEY